MKVNVNTGNVEDLLKIPGVGEKTAQKIINTRGESPFTLHSLCDLLRKDPQEIEKVVTFEEVIIQSDRSHDLSDMKSTMDLCDERNAAFSWEETRPKKHVRSYKPTDERREAPSASQYDEGRRRRQYSAEFQEDQHSRYFREHQRSGQLHNRDSRRQYGYDSDESDNEPEHSRKFIQPPKGYPPPPQEVLQSNGQETKRASWGSRSCPTGCPKDSPALEVLNPNGLDPPYEPQRMVNQNGLDPPRQLRKVVNPNGLDPPDQLGPKKELDLVASEGATGMQNQEMASVGEQSITRTGVRNMQSQEVVPAYTVRADVGNVSVDAIIDTAAEITIISEEVYKRLIPRPRLSGKRRVQMAGKGQESWANLVGPISVKVGPLSTQETIYVAQINDDMLLGVDFLDKYNAVIDFKDHTLQVQGKRIPLRTLVSDRRSKAYLKQRLQSLRILVWETAYGLSGDGLNQEADHVHERNPVIRGCQVTPDLPSHLEPLWLNSKIELDDQQAESLRSLLAEYQDVFAKSDFDLGNFTAVYHTVDTGQAAPIKQRMRRTPIHFKGEEDVHLDKMLEARVVQPSVSEWASPPVLVRKRDGSVRWCVDYRALNKITRKDVFPLPRIEDCVDALDGNLMFSKLDANSAYWQVRLDEESKPKTAFCTRRGLFEFVRMPFGLCNAPATFSRVINLVLSGLNWESVLAFLDDVCVLGRSYDNHIDNLRKVFERFRTYGLRLKPRKCSLFRREVEFLGRLVSKNGIQILPESIAAVQKWPVPRAVKDIQRFMGLTNYHRLFIKDYSRVAEPLFRILRNNEFRWGEEEEQSFENLKKALTETPVLGIPSTDDPFILDTDASDVAIGAELIQLQAGVERVIGYGSYTLSKEQRNYCTTRKELLAVVRFIRQFRPYLLGRHFKVRMDHNSLRWLTNFKEPQGQLARWLEELSQYDMEIIHRPGKQHGNADALSRMPHGEECPSYNASSLLTALPCGGCKYCQRMQRSWGKFMEEVDDVIPYLVQ
ncbi:Pol polyprotein [Plakobranchus ocellatus]|uniref:RNA-directed DNA polymerase n=1 Tax=Plakobranchus ocellatus TaxID=259542 RepID=A0AAV4BBL1_9GAST|nr:Pol polyprotein [Plakobranchus ocellatus]